MLSGEENDHNVSWTKPNGGLGVDGHSQTHEVLVAFFTGLGLYNAIELVGMVFLTFRKYNGTYFWSLLVAAFGIVCASLCNILKTFDRFNTGDAEYATLVLGTQLILINAIIIAMDLGVLLLEATARHILQILVKNLIYSIKLKLEFAILGKLVRCVGSKDSALEGSSKTCVSFITAVPKLDAEDMEGGATGATDPDLVHSNIIYPSRSDTRTHKCDLDYKFARFRHLENIATLQLSPAHFQDSLQRQHVTPEKEG
ncbi:integral membrane protein [Teratosphaeria destructans]|uniref:Integral membrane protein n=1 Tax=Teratosphaeria destructans TaxID=418781 RepID=A0A9W7SII9_9PEZI|nr:integral membrane protein [Teratosphaeria destructans]